MNLPTVSLSFLEEPMKLSEQSFPKLILSPALKNLHRSASIVPTAATGMYKKAIAMQPADVTEEVKRSGLRGRGGEASPPG